MDLLVDLDPLGFDRTILAATSLARATAVGELPSMTSFTLTLNSS